MSNGSGWTDRLTQLNDLLAELYPDRDAARQVVRKAGLPPGSIRFHPAAGTNWFNILEEAQRRNRVDAVIKIARAEFPERLDEWATIADAAAASPVVPADNSRPAGRPLDRTARKQLHQALLSAFPSLTTLNQLLSLGMDQNLAAIAQGNLSDSVLQVLQWAEAMGRVDELISAASEANPGNPELAAFVQSRR